VLCAQGREVWSQSSHSLSHTEREVGQTGDGVTGEGLQETPKSDSTKDEHGRLLEEHKDFPLRL